MEDNLWKNDIYNDVSEELEILSSVIAEFENMITETVAQLAKEKKLNLIPAQLEIADKVSKFINKIEELKVDWKNIDVNNQFISQNTIEEKKGVHERTDWWLADGSIKIKTKRLEGSPYSNVIPVNLFKDIAKTAMDIAKRKGFVKTVDIQNLMETEIISQSDYKKTPRIPVYATFKVMVKEKALKVDDNNSHEYLPCMDSEEFSKWLKDI